MLHTLKTLTPLIVCALILLVFSPALAGEKTVLATDPFPPYTIVDGENLSGIGIEIINEAFRRAKRKLEITIVPWKRAQRLSQRGKVDGIFTIFFTEERSHDYVFSKEILGYSDLVLMTQSGSDIGFDGNLQSVMGETIAVPLGYNAGSKLEIAFESGIVRKMQVPSTDIGLKMLAKGRMKLLSDNGDVLKFLAKETGVLDQVTVLEPPISSTPFHVAYSRVLPTSTALRNDIDLALHQMWADGTIKNIYAKYTQRSSE